MVDVGRCVSAVVVFEKAWKSNIKSPVDEVFRKFYRLMLGVVALIFVFGILFLISGFGGFGCVLSGLIILYVAGFFVGYALIAIICLVKRGELLEIKAKGHIVAGNELSDAVRQFSYGELECALAGFKVMKGVAEGRLMAICGPVVKLGLMPVFLTSLLALKQLLPDFSIEDIVDDRFGFCIFLFILALLFMQIYAFINSDVDGKRSAVISLVEKVMSEKRQTEYDNAADVWSGHRPSSFGN